VCARCGDFVCARCGECRDEEILCKECSSLLPKQARPLPSDGDGPLFQRFRETSVLVLRHPNRTFSQLANGRIDPAWHFAWLWCTAKVACGGLLQGRSTLAFFASPLLAAVVAPIQTFLTAALHYGLARALGSKTDWTWSVRASGYASAWEGPALAVGALAWLVQDSPALAWSLIAAGELVGSGGVVYALFAFGRGRGQLSSTRAALAAVSAVAPFVSVFAFRAFLRP
jgi:hypothetical protein